MRLLFYNLQLSCLNVIIVAKWYEQDHVCVCVFLKICSVDSVNLYIILIGDVVKVITVRMPRTYVRTL